MVFFFFSSRRRHTRYWRDWSSDVCSSDLRQVERKRIDTFDLAELSLHQRLQLDRRALAFVPRLEQHARDAVLRTVDAVQGETKIGLREAFEYLVELLAVKVQVIDVGVFRRLGHGKHDALIFLRREFLRRMHIKETDESEDRQREQSRDWTIVERTVELPAIPARHRTENPVHDP